MGTSVEVALDHQNKVINGFPSKLHAESALEVEVSTLLRVRMEKGYSLLSCCHPRPKVFA